jgi:hypothetical protein
MNPIWEKELVTGHIYENLRRRRKKQTRGTVGIMVDSIDKEVGKGGD